MKELKNYTVKELTMELAEREEIERELNDAIHDYLGDVATINNNRDMGLINNSEYILLIKNAVHFLDTKEDNIKQSFKK